MFFSILQKQNNHRDGARSRFHNRKKMIFAGTVFVGIVGAVLLTRYIGDTASGQNRAFEKFTNQMFCQETASNTISLHYTLKNPEQFGIEQGVVTLGTFPVEPETLLASVENLNQALETFSYKKLSADNQLTYDVLDYYLEIAEEDAKYLLYEEPLGIVSGVQTQLPVVLSEYQFYEKDDVDTYLKLLETVPSYFESLIAFERAKSAAGLFMSDTAANKVEEQCTAFINMRENNYLISTFVERINQVSELSEKEKSDYIQKNASALEKDILPAYENLTAVLRDLQGTGKNEQGLCYFPEGKSYYEHVAEAMTGSDRSVEEMRDLTRRQMSEDLSDMEAVLGISGAGEEKDGRLTGNESTEEKDGQFKENEGVGEKDGQFKENEGVGEKDGQLTGNESMEEKDGQLTGNESMEEKDGQFKENESVEETIGQLTEEGQAARESAPIQVAAQIPQNPVSILKELQTKTAVSFPEPPDIAYSVKYVPEALEEHLSPAFYMIPAIDAYQENVIYVNQAQMGNALTLYTTLAHEGYPGHLYQTVYYASRNPNPIRTILNFGGYVEGWATYAEMGSYYLAPLTKEQATLLQKNSSIILGIYTLADIGIHYEGWSRADTLSFFSGYGIQDVDTVNQIYDLIIGCPGNYLKYYIGYVEFLELKKQWSKEKGTEFSQKEFHEAVLDVGPAPFEIVEKYMGSVEKMQKGTP